VIKGGHQSSTGNAWDHDYRPPGRAGFVGDGGLFRNHFHEGFRCGLSAP